MHELVTDKKNTKERLQNAIMDFVTGYGLLGFMTALTTTPDFITYHAVYLPKNHFIKEESMTTENIFRVRAAGAAFCQQYNANDDYRRCGDRTTKHHTALRLFFLLFSDSLYRSI